MSEPLYEPETEINTNPDLKLRPKPDKVAVREQSIALFRKNFLAALAEIDTPKPPVRNGRRKAEAY